MKDYIEKLLLEKGCTNVQWKHGRNGWYALVREDNSTMCYNIGYFVNGYLDYELGRK